MKKIIFLFLFSISFLNAYSFYNGKCVDSYSVARINPTTYNLKIVYADTTFININGSLTSLEDTYLPKLLANDGKFFPTKQSNLIACGSSDNSNYYGMTKEQFTFLMALTGSLCGFTFLFFACFLAIGFGRK